jgi:PIN domain nuclease of toxin-antitoxin system
MAPWCVLKIRRKGESCRIRLAGESPVAVTAGAPIDEAAMPYLAGFPPLHRDPFDRLLVAQATPHRLSIATVDPEMSAYPIPFTATA